MCVEGAALQMSVRRHKSLQPARLKRTHNQANYCSIFLLDLRVTAPSGASVWTPASPTAHPLPPRLPTHTQTYRHTHFSPSAARAGLAGVADVASGGRAAVARWLPLTQTQ